MIEFVYNNVTHFFTNVFSYYFMYDYYLKIHYVIENDFIEKEIFAKNKIKHLHNVKKTLMKYLKYIVVKQMKYYNQKNIFKKFNIDDLIIFNIKNLKQ